MKKILPMCEPFTTTYPIEANAVSIMLSHAESFPWLMNNFIQIGCVDNTFLGYYDFNYKNCPYIDYQRIKSDLVISNNSLISFVIDSISKGYYIDMLVNTKHIRAYKNLSKNYAHDAMIYGFDTAGFTAVELYGEHDSDARQAADMFAISSGLGLPNHIADGAAIVTLARMACFFPILITVIILLMMLWKTSRSFNKTTQHIIWFSLALIAALLLPYWLENIPQWMIPSMWSDFSFWGSLLQTIKFRIEEWFLIVPTVKEVHIKFLMLYQVSIIFIETSITSALVIKNFTFISEVKKV